jgi:competence ComEA-like helix-hairpin-helix protein
MNTDGNLPVSVNSALSVSFVLSLSFLLVFTSIAYAQKTNDAPKRLDLNKATAEELDTLPEVGPKLAKSIVAFREKSGPFRRVEDLLAVPGISKRRLEKIRPHVYVEPPRKTQNSELRTNPRDPSLRRASLDFARDDSLRGSV